MILLKFGWLTWQGWTEPIILPIPFILHIYLEYLIHLNHDCSRRGVSPVAQCKESTCQCRRCGFDPWVAKVLWRRKWKPTPVFLPGESHGQRSLVGYSLRGCKQSVDWAHTRTVMRKSLWWLILCVNWAGPQYPGFWSNTIFDVLLKYFGWWD